MPSKKRLGLDNERQVVERLRGQGIKATQQPGSGVFKDYPNDVVIEDRILAECKVRTTLQNAKGDRIIPFDSEWLEGCEKNAKEQGYSHGVVFVKRKMARTRLVVMSEDYFIELLKGE
jgi:Holliday junction resolvase